MQARFLVMVAMATSFWESSPNYTYTHTHLPPWDFTAEQQRCCSQDWGKQNVCVSMSCCGVITLELSCSRHREEHLHHTGAGDNVLLNTKLLSYWNTHIRSSAIFKPLPFLKVLSCVPGQRSVKHACMSFTLADQPYIRLWSNIKPLLPIPCSSRWLLTSTQVLTMYTSRGRLGVIIGFRAELHCPKQRHANKDSGGLQSFSILLKYMHH